MPDPWYPARFCNTGAIEYPILGEGPQNRQGFFFGVLRSKSILPFVKARADALNLLRKKWCLRDFSKTRRKFLLSLAVVADALFAVWAPW
jgi:hypothetical protein